VETSRDKVKVRPLRPWEKRKLQRLKRQRTNAVNSRHARIVLLSRGGLRNRAIAARCDCTPQWVRQIIHRFNERGPDGLTWYPWMAGAGQASRFTADVLGQIACVALSSPVALIGLTRWSLTKLRDYLVEQQVVAALGREWLRVLLHRLGGALAPDQDREGVRRPGVRPEVPAAQAVVPALPRRRAGASTSSAR
jgi:transposase